MPSSPSTTPFSAYEAKDRLREIVEAFFFRRRNGRGEIPARQLLVRSPPGLGKTKEAMEWATRYQIEQEGKESILEVSRSDITLAGARAQVDLENRIAALIRRADASDLKPNILVTHGTSIYAEILAVAEEAEADLVVVGSDRPAMKGYLLGTNAARVVRHARCSVLVARD
jgi:nucleotide-binding universal stress UspA family protein